MNIHQLQRASLSELEAIYAETRPDHLPSGRFRGTHLMRVDRAGARRPLYAASVGFQVVPFGVDFDRCVWFFLSPGLQVGRFVPRPGPSRWRDARVLQLRYSMSRLPMFVRRLLYDEVKPLSPELALGIGGINDERGRGDHFFFALQRMR